MFKCDCETYKYISTFTLPLLDRRLLKCMFEFGLGFKLGLNLNQGELFRSGLC